MCSSDLFALISYIPFLEHFEKHIHNLPMKSEYITLSVFMRNANITGFSFLRRPLLCTRADVLYGERNDGRASVVFNACFARVYHRKRRRYFRFVSFYK